MRLKRTTALALCLLVGALALYLVPLTHCQDTHPGHTSEEAFEDSIGLKKVIVMAYDDRLVYFKRELKMRVELGSVAFDRNTKFPDGKKTGCYWLVYCKTHDFLYFMVPCKEE